MKIGGLQKVSLIDYPNKISAVVFTQGCNFRCSYCHNPELLALKSGNISEDFVIDFLEKRKKQIEAVVVTGGEPTLQTDLIDFLKKIKEMGYLVKLDTNGSNFEVLKKIIDLKLVDYVAMDIKSEIDKYGEITQVRTDENNILESINYIKIKAIDYEFRTTIAREQLEISDMENIGVLINGAKKYVLQKYVSRENDKNILNVLTSYSDEEMSRIKKILVQYVDEVQIR